MHIGIILDGNRRYAKEKSLKPWEGHRYGAENVKNLLTWCKELNVRELTLFTFSIENFKRPEKERTAIFNLFRENLRKIKEKIREEKIRINFIGRIEMFPKDITNSMKGIMEETRKNSGHIVNFAVAYGGRAEIVDTVKKITGKVIEGEFNINDINEETITSNLYLKSEPDMIIRPGGEIRVSNFLIWQSYYSEWYFTKKLWPEFTKEDLKEAILEFKQRKRRFGK